MWHYAQRPTFIMYQPPAGPVEGSQPYEVRPLLGYIGGGRLIKYNPMNGDIIGNYSIRPVNNWHFLQRPLRFIRADYRQRCISTVPSDKLDNTGYFYRR